LKFLSLGALAMEMEILAEERSKIAMHSAARRDTRLQADCPKGNAQNKNQKRAKNPDFHPFFSSSISL